MKSVVLPGKYPVDIITIVKEMEELGWKNNIDFEWRYTPARYSMEGNTERYTTFTFYSEEFATIFKLKWT